MNLRNMPRLPFVTSGFALELSVAEVDVARKRSNFRLHLLLNSLFHLDDEKGYCTIGGRILCHYSIHSNKFMSLYHPGFCQLIN